MPTSQTDNNKLHHGDLPRFIGEASTFIQSNPADYALLGKSTNSRRTYISRLNQFARLFQFGSYVEVPWHLLRHEHVLHLVKVLKAQNVATATINTTLSTLRAVSREAFNLGQLSGEDLARILHVELVKGSGLPTGRHVSVREITALVRICEHDEHASGIRDIAMIGLLYACGLRRIEITQLVIGDFNQSDNSITLTDRNMSERKCWPDMGTKEALLDWFEARGAHLLDDNSPMFTSIRKGGRIMAHAITDQSVYNMIIKRSNQAGLRPFTPHDFRRSFVTNLLDNNVDVLTAQGLAGHSNPATTLRYVRRKKRLRKPAMETIRLPYSR